MARYYALLPFWIFGGWLWLTGGPLWALALVALGFAATLLWAMRRSFEEQRNQSIWDQMQMRKLGPYIPTSVNDVDRMEAYERLHGPYQHPPMPRGWKPPEEEKRAYYGRTVRG